MTHICVSKEIIIGSDNGLSPCRRQASIWTNAGILLIGPLGTNFGEILIKIHTFSFTKMHLKMSGKLRPFYLCLNVLNWSVILFLAPCFTKPSATMVQSSAVITQSNGTWYCIQTAVTEGEYKSEFESTKDTPFFALTGELWGVFSEYFGENLSRYKGTTLYWLCMINMSLSTMRKAFNYLHHFCVEKCCR